METVPSRKTFFLLDYNTIETEKMLALRLRSLAFVYTVECRIDGDTALLVGELLERAADQEQREIR
jgi:hypothetical protein